MFETFESHAHQWIERHTAAAEQCCQRRFADTPSSQSALERFIRAAATANPPIVLPSFAQESFLRACSENLIEDEEGGAPSCEPEPRLNETVAVPLGCHNKLFPIPPAYVDGDDRFERQDPQTVHGRFETIDQTFIGMAGNLYQLREVIDYWLPKDQLEFNRYVWLPSRLIEHARFHTIFQLDNVQNCFTDHLQIMNNSLCQLREGTFGGRLNNITVVSAKELFEKLLELRRLVRRVQTPANDRTQALKEDAEWYEKICLPVMIKVQEPFQPERFNPQDPESQLLAKMFQHHWIGIIQTVKFCKQASEHLSNIFETIDCICKTILEGLHKIMCDVHMGLTTGEFIASWANRWERVVFGLLVKVLGLPAINAGLEHDFPGYDVDLS
ncbi:hypothetical protein CROQUDRAFT_105630 [Cronartium quercuum f. sp. fusiforme G11]|uniref:Uncharacterized protein n=1 Tax=Cronartium quercuum f. sp. fusiforme G11 TaxID=708437 RepID=A0A9P6NR57_9BASI|nr:hypothetical protein CROQUDRAFT_105630 [Cronartium quercuum f. sp. fusiforme G11]